MTIKNFSGIILAGCMLVFGSCTEEVNDDIVTPPAFAEFGTSNLLGKYFITNSASSAFKIPIGITNVTNSDRTIQLNISSPTGAQSGVQYTAPSSIVIPAGKAADSLIVKGLFAGYPTGRRDTLRIAISGGDALVNTYNNTYDLVMQKYCDVSITALQGNYTKTTQATPTGGSAAGPYTVVLTNMQSLSATTARGVLQGLELTNYGLPLDDIQIVLDWTDPANFTVTMAQQYTGWDYDVNQPIDIRSSPGQANTFSSCDQSLSLTVDYIVNNYPTAGSSAYFSRNYKVNIKR